MSPRPKTIQIYLPGGDPQGVRVAEITTRIVQVIEVPRALLSDFLAMPESEQVAVYFLFGGSEEMPDLVYIGQSGSLRDRLVSHNKNKDFWQKALVLISRTNSLTQTHALFLEWHCIQQATKADRFRLENSTTGTKPHTPAPLEADCLEIHETAQVLLSTLGFPLFESLGEIEAHTPKDEIFLCTAAGTNGRGLYTPGGFVVLKGSTGRVANVHSLSGTSLERFRNRLIVEGVMKVEGETMVFQKDHLFGSPSMAAIALLGRTANGWITWKSPNGKTLDELKREGPK
jgi:hypothetical protein